MIPTGEVADRTVHGAVGVAVHVADVVELARRAAGKTEITPRNVAELAVRRRVRRVVAADESVHAVRRVGDLILRRLVHAVVIDLHRAE